MTPATLPGDAGLPVKVIDEEIYENPPTLLVGTVDKFALLPWYPESRSIFGIDRENSPPDLVIQDELHLISGPLGSMVGHYETLIEELCRRDFEGQELSCKIVASTATISRAAEQISSLYGRSPGKAKAISPAGSQGRRQLLCGRRYKWNRTQIRRHFCLWPPVTGDYSGSGPRLASAITSTCRSRRQDHRSLLDTDGNISTVYVNLGMRPR